MRTDLDWEISDDEGSGAWEPSPERAPKRPAPPPGTPRRPRVRLPRWSRRRWLIVLALAAAVAGPLGWLAWQARFALQDQRDAVLRVAALEDQLAERGDTDALLALQDPDYPRWQAWRELHMLSAPGDAPGLAPFVRWSMLPAVPYVLAGPAEYGDVRFDGQLASLAVTRRYRAGNAADEPPSLTLQTTQYYRYVRGGWLHTGPPAGGEGAMVRAPGRSLRFVYPSQDAPILEPMAARLEALAGQVCSDVGCGSGQPSLVVSADLAVLVPAAYVPPDQAALTAYLPAPSLIGRPQGPQSAESLYQLYARRLVALMVVDVAIQRRLTIEPWLSWELAHLGLGDAPPAEELRQAARDGLAGGSTPGAGQLTPAVIWLALDFLAQESPSANPLRGLFRSGGVPPEGPAAEDRLAAELATRQAAWRAYLERVAAPSGQACPAVLPVRTERGGGASSRR